MDAYLDYEAARVDYSEYLSKEEGSITTTGKTIDDCLKPFKRGKFVGKGMFGSVIEACENGDKCHRFVAKIQKGNWESFIMLQIQLRIEEGKLPQIMPKLEKTCQTNGEEVIIMERMDGSLFSKGATTKKQIGDIIKEVEELHSQGMVHQDLKFNNFLYKGKRVYLGDFGLARMNANRNQFLLDWLLLAVSLILNDLPLPRKLVDKIKSKSRRKEKWVLELASGIIKEATYLRKKKGLKPILLSSLSPEILFQRLGNFQSFLLNSKGQSWNEISEVLPIKMPGARGI